MRRDLCIFAVGLLIFVDSDKNWAQEPAKESPSSPTVAPVHPVVAGQQPSKNSNADVEAEFKRLAGAWQPETAMLAGEQLPDEICRQIRLELSNGRFKTMANGIESSGTIVLDLAAEPRGMDITIEVGPDAGKSIKCVYKFEDDHLHVAYSMAFDEVRPTEFESNQDNKQLLIVYRRPEQGDSLIEPAKGPPGTNREK